MWHFLLASSSVSLTEEIFFSLFKRKRARKMEEEGGCPFLYPTIVSPNFPEWSLHSGLCRCMRLCPRQGHFFPNHLTLFNVVNLYLYEYVRILYINPHPRTHDRVYTGMFIYIERETERRKAQISLSSDVITELRELFIFTIYVSVIAIQYTWVFAIHHT